MGVARPDALPLGAAAGRGTPGAGRSDSELVSAYLDGDRRAFGVLYERHHPRLLAFCRQRVKTQQCAEDIAHEVMIRALTYLEGFDRDRPMWPWLKTIARNQLVDHYRSSSRLVDVSDEALPDVDPNADEHPVWLAERDVLVQAMEDLSSRDRDVLTLKYVGDWDSDELQREFGVERPALYKLLQRARDRLRAAYEKIAESSLGIALVALLIRSVRSWFERLRARLAGLEQALIVGPASTELAAYSLAVLALAAGVGAAQEGSADGAMPRQPPLEDVAASSPDAWPTGTSALRTDHFRSTPEFGPGATADPIRTTVDAGGGDSSVFVSTGAMDESAPLPVEGNVALEASEQRERTVNDRVEARIGEEGPWGKEGVTTVYCTGSTANRTVCAVYDEVDEEAPSDAQQASRTATDRGSRVPSAP